MCRYSDLGRGSFRADATKPVHAASAALQLSCCLCCSCTSVSGAQNAHLLRLSARAARCHRYCTLVASQTLGEHPLCAHGSTRRRRGPLLRRRIGIAAQKTHAHPITALREKDVWTFDEAREYARSLSFAPRTSTSSTAAPVRTRCLETRSRRLGTAGRHGRTIWDSAPTWCGSDAAGPEQVLFVEMGWGADQHGQNATKRVCARLGMLSSSSTVWKSSAIDATSTP